MLIDDAVPDPHGVEFGMPLRTGVLLLVHDPEIQLPDLVPAQVYALVGEEVRRAAEDLVHAFIGLDPDQSAVHVERDRSNIHACILPDPGGPATSAGSGRSGGQQLHRLGDESSAVLMVDVVVTGDPQ